MRPPAAVVGGCIGSSGVPQCPGMESSGTVKRLIHIPRCLWVVVLLASTFARGDGLRLESAGARYGIPGSASATDFREAVVYSNWKLPWQWDLGHDWHLQSRLDFSLGWLGDSHADAAIGTLGPSLLLNRRDFPVSVEAGISPTFLSHDNFGDKNFGVPVQFTSHVGLNWNFTSHLRLSYRFQHMSNAGLSNGNPGLNLHMVGLSYLF